MRSRPRLLVRHYAMSRQVRTGHQAVNMLLTIYVAGYESSWALARWHCPVSWTAEKAKSQPPPGLPTGLPRLPHMMGGTKSTLNPNDWTKGKLAKLLIHPQDERICDPGNYILLAVVYNISESKPGQSLRVRNVKYVRPKLLYSILPTRRTGKRKVIVSLDASMYMSNS